MLTAKFFALGLALFGSSFAGVALAQGTESYKSSDLIARELDSFSANLAARQEFLVRRSDAHIDERDLAEEHDILNARSFEEDELVARDLDERTFEDDDLVARDLDERSFDEDELFAREIDERSFDEDDLVARDLDERSFDEDELVARDLDERSVDEHLLEARGGDYPEATLAEHLASRDLHEDLEARSELEDRSFEEGDELVARDLEDRSFDEGEELVLREVLDERSFDDHTLEARGGDYPEATLAEHLASRELHEDLEARSELEDRSFDEGEDLVLREVLEDRSFDEDELVAREFHQDFEERSLDEDELFARDLEHDD